MNDYCDRPANYIFINITALDLQEMQQFHPFMSNRTACTLSLVCQAVTMIYEYAGVYLTIVCFHGQADAGKNAGIFIEKTVISLLPQCNRAW